MPGVLLCCSARQAHRGAPLAGVLLCSLVCQALKRAPLVGSYCLVQRLRCLMGQPLCCSAAGLCGERGCGEGSTPYADSAVSPCFHGCPAFLHRHFPPQSPPSHPLDLSLCSQQQPSPCSTESRIAPQFLNSSSQPLHLPGGLCPCLGYAWLCKDCLILIPFKAATDQLFHSHP